MNQSDSSEKKFFLTKIDVSNFKRVLIVTALKPLTESIH